MDAKVRTAITIAKQFAVNLELDRLNEYVLLSASLTDRPSSEDVMNFLTGLWYLASQQIFKNQNSIGTGSDALMYRFPEKKTRKGEPMITSVESITHLYTATHFSVKEFLQKAN